MKKHEAKEGLSPSRLIDERIESLGDWRGTTLARVRAMIKEADPEVVEAWKWRGVPVWEHDGIICTGESYKSVVKLTFFKGAALDDPAGLFNSSLEGNARRAIDIHEGESIDAKALKALVRAAVALNLPTGKKTPSSRQPRAKSAAAATRAPATIDEYIATAAPEVRPILDAVRATVRKAAPGAEERISYRMPAFFLDGVVVYFAAFKKHIGMFPGVSDATLQPLLARYRGPKGNLQFPLAEPMPHALIAKVVKARLRAVKRAAAAART